MPKQVIPACSARSQSTPMSGKPGLPSKRTIAASVRSPQTRKFHIIQPVVVNQNRRSPGRASRWRCSFLRCSSRIPPWPVDDRLRQAGGARGVEDPERMVERERREAEGLALARHEELVPAGHVLQLRRTGGRGGLRVEVGDQDGVPDAGDRLLQLPTIGRAVEVLAAVAVAVDAEQHLRLDLGEAVDHACRRRSPARREDQTRRSRRRRGRRASPRGCSAGRRRRGRRSRRPGRAGRRRPRPTFARSSPQVDLLQLAQLGGVEDRDLIVVLAGEDVLGEVQARRRGTTPRRASRARPSAGPRSPSYCDVEVVEDRVPEALEVVDRPAARAPGRRRRRLPARRAAGR